MPKQQIKILGINPGAKYIGLAAFRGPELRDWRVRVNKGKWSEEKMAKAMGIVAGFFQQHDPDAVAIKSLHPSRSSPELNRLANKIKDFAKRRRMRVCEFSLGDLEDFFCPEGWTNRRMLAEVIASRYPALHHELAKEKSHMNPYHVRMFEAVALAARCFHDLDKR